MYVELGTTVLTLFLSMSGCFSAKSAMYIHRIYIRMYGTACAILFSLFPFVNVWFWPTLHTRNRCTSVHFFH